MGLCQDALAVCDELFSGPDAHRGSLLVNLGAAYLQMRNPEQSLSFLTEGIAELQAAGEAGVSLASAYD